MFMRIYIKQQLTFEAQFMKKLTSSLKISDLIKNNFF